MELSIQRAYPELRLDAEGLVISNISFPHPLRVYKEKVRKFNQNLKVREEINAFAADITKKLAPDESENLQLTWDEELGLRSINFKPSRGFDLQTEGLIHYAVHNAQYDLKATVIAHLTIEKYFRELIRLE